MYANLTDDGSTHRIYVDDGLPWINRRATFWGFVISLTLISWLSVALRIHTRVFRVRCTGWDDAIILLAQITATISAICLCVSSNYGLGQRSADVFSYDKMHFFKLFWVANAVFTMSNALVKLSLLAQYLRIFENSVVRLHCKILMGLITIWGSVYSFIAWFPCFPPSGFWEFGSTATCYGYASPNPLRVYQTTVSATASNMAFDIVTWALPIHLLAKKDLGRKTKKALITLLLLGTIILGIAAGRCVANGATAEMTPDPFWSFPTIVLLGECENRLACIVASIPIFWPVVEEAAGRIQDLYRIIVTQEFLVGSSRILPGEVMVGIGAYEAPHWAESQSGTSRSSVEGREKDDFPTLSEMRLPQWPSSEGRGQTSDDSSTCDSKQRTGGSDKSV